MKKHARIYFISGYIGAVAGAAAISILLALLDIITLMSLPLWIITMPLLLFGGFCAGAFIAITVMYVRGTLPEEHENHLYEHQVDKENH